MHGREPRLECGNCEYWLARHAATGVSEEAARAAHERAMAAGSPIAEGRCNRYPQPVPKSRIELCGEHSELEGERRIALANDIATALSSNVVNLDHHRTPR